MRNNREMNYGRFSQQYNEGEHPEGHYQGRKHAYLGDTRHEPGQDYRLQQSHEYGRRGGDTGMREAYYNQMYDISNYSDQPRHEEYGLPRSAENDLDTVRRFPYAYDEPNEGRRHYRYNTGYNPNYDNPEEGDRYRDFDSRGNHGYRHDASYGNDNEFLEFRNEQDNLHDKVGNRNYGHFWRL